MSGDIGSLPEGILTQYVVKSAQFRVAIRALHAHPRPGKVARSSCPAGEIIKIHLFEANRSAVYGV